MGVFLACVSVRVHSGSHSSPHDSNETPWKAKVLEQTSWGDNNVDPTATKKYADVGKIKLLKNGIFKLTTGEDNGFWNSVWTTNWKKSPKFIVKKITVFEDQNKQKGVFLQLESKNRFLPVINRYIWPFDPESGLSIGRFHAMLQSMIRHNKPKIDTIFYVCHKDGQLGKLRLRWLKETEK